MPVIGMCGFAALDTVRRLPRPAWALPRFGKAPRGTVGPESAGGRGLRGFEARLHRGGEGVDAWRVCEVADGFGEASA